MNKRNWQKKNELTEYLPNISIAGRKVRQFIERHRKRDEFLNTLLVYTIGAAFALFILCVFYAIIEQIIHFFGPQLPLLTGGFWIVFVVLSLTIPVLEIAGKYYHTATVAQSLEGPYTILMEVSTLAEETYREQGDDIREKYGIRLAECQGRYEEDRGNCVHQFQTNVDQCKSLLQKYMHEDGLLVAGWDDSRWQQWQPLQYTTAVARLGTIVGPSDIQSFQFPLLPVFAVCSGGENLLLEIPGDGEAKQAALGALQSLMLRLLATQRPGKLHFTLIDPVGLGDRFAIFMQLADYDGELIGHRIWTKKEHIEHQLGLLSEHIEVVTQNYLQGQYRSIDEYNIVAGELAEPYRVLVIMDFPVNFSEEAIDQLRSIFIKGPSCGISTFMIIDTEQPLPPHFNLTKWKDDAHVITWRSGSFVRSKSGGKCELDLDRSPVLPTFNYLLRRIGEEAKEAQQRVEIPFKRIIERVAPEYCWWTNDRKTCEAISAPLGRISATRYQDIELGKGTAHHALVIGTTGSGKTNLLHVLILGLSLIYSPDELEFYLVDFKTVGFTPYATYKLPHAHVIAIQSEREFGLSVLKGLDAELEQRKDMLSRSGVQNLVQYRRLQPKAHMPRILLIIDEFQELFVQEDEIATQSALLLDRLVRMGRAFGIHIILASQTLVGRPTIDQSTLSQIAVRIALRCDQADYPLVLNEDNTKAKLLSQFRPGQVIYNAANGVEAGNSEFQCAWLPEDDLHIYLNAIQQLAQRRGFVPAWQQNIFDGSRNADISQNQVLHRYLEAPRWSTIQQQACTIWLGTPIAIQNPTSLSISSGAGSNILIVGQHEEAASGILMSALLALIAQHAPGNARFYVIDFRQEDVYRKRLRYLEEKLPQKVKVIDKRKLASTMVEISDMVADRREEDDETYLPVYVFFYGLQRARDLRYADSSPDIVQRFYAILQEGPEVDVHAFIWCDTLTNMHRIIKPELMHEFEMRIVFQIIKEDSISLIGSDLANRLGSHRALLFNGETGTHEKFIPYGLPPDWWLEWAIDHLCQKYGVTTVTDLLSE